MIEKVKKNYFLIIGTFLFLYFFFNLLDGERGLLSLIKKENLLTKNFDKDYVETLLREKFNYSMNNEKIYILKNDN